MSRIPIGLQLYSVRHECERDLPGTLAEVARMGYDGVEFAGYYGYSAEDLRKLLDDLDLKCCGTHIRLDTLLGDELPKTVAFNKTLGNPYLIVPGLAEERRNSRAAWQGTARIFNDIAAKLRPQGMFAGYHNHHIEFQPMDGELPWDTFFGGTAKDVVMQLDTGNARDGGADPGEFLAKYPGRALTVHLKEYSATNPAAYVGEGEEDWARVFGLCESIGKTKWYIVEYEVPGASALTAVARCVENLRKMGK